MDDSTDFYLGISCIVLFFACTVCFTARCVSVTCTKIEGYQNV
jgi:hypothetical protein